ncbi:MULTISPECIES: hypothetical protein [Moraxella]|uniref:Uncharacterized protein n=1 Tax=Moraxella lacunata TaxID=477 RepID=A0A1B8Q5L1_MORLA|nr:MULTISPECIES: hypothetical protein [Moraxella]MBE9579270.1 hypothetical protein [Moraxella sp. K1664]MBE9588040.1 hypothetical protein [Moraxella sp. K1630]MBE9595415.1 hypothetical protein [Moraxella sp. K2450]MDH9219392.1 hypothetical protein [Moraxella lacunata]MDI4483346.1 hypothetical protein [Moraxella lacunata]
MTNTSDEMYYLWNNANKYLLLIPRVFFLILPIIILFFSFFVSENYDGFFGNNIASVMPGKSKWIADMIQCLTIIIAITSTCRFFYILKSGKLREYVNIFIKNENKREYPIKSYKMLLMTFIVIYAFLFHNLFDVASYSPVHKNIFDAMHQFPFIYCIVRIIGLYFFWLIQISIFLFVGVNIYEHEM